VDNLLRQLISHEISIIGSPKLLVLWSEIDVDNDDYNPSMNRYAEDRFLSPPFVEESTLISSLA
jgi:hypothetical protein